MIGHTLHLHRSKKASSSAAYVIVDVEPSTFSGRVVFVLGEQRGTRPAPDKWPRQDYVFMEEDPYEQHVVEAKAAAGRKDA
jgi:hypothetical protein